jgi:hypothetical protein
MIGKIFRGLAPVFAMAAATGLSGCDGVNISINDKEGVPLAELDMAGKAPTELVLAGPDNVVVTEGETLDIDVSGDQAAVDALRFTLDDSTLGIMRAKGERVDGKATVRVTMPTLEKLVVAGSGTVEAPRLAGSPEVTIAGSGFGFLRGRRGRKLPRPDDRRVRQREHGRTQNGQGRRDHRRIGQCRVRLRRHGRGQRDGLGRRDRERQRQVHDQLDGLGHAALLARERCARRRTGNCRVIHPPDTECGLCRAGKEFPCAA